MGDDTKIADVLHTEAKIGKGKREIFGSLSEEMFIGIFKVFVLLDFIDYCPYQTG